MFEKLHKQRILIRVDEDPYSLNEGLIAYLVSVKVIGCVNV